MRSFDQCLTMTCVPLCAAEDHSHALFFAHNRLPPRRRSLALNGAIWQGAVAYDHRDAAGFIKLNALRLRTLGQRKEEAGAMNEE